jgi:hypothetical protein
MSYKKLIISLLILSFMIILPGCLGKLLPTTPSVTPGADKAGVLYLTPTQVNTAPSKDFTANLNIGEVTGFKGYSVTLSYNPAYLKLQEVSEGTFLSSEGETFFYHQIDNKKGTVLIDCALLGKTLSTSGEGTLASLSFTCLKAGSTGIEFSLAKTRDAQNKEIVTTKRNSLIKSK